MTGKPCYVFETPHGPCVIRPSRKAGKWALHVAGTYIHDYDTPEQAVEELSRPNFGSLPGGLTTEMLGVPSSIAGWAHRKI